jgi:hypothetical protein
MAFRPVGLQRPRCSLPFASVSVGAPARAPRLLHGKANLSLNGGRFALAQQCLGLGEGGLVREGGEEFVCFA